MANETAAMVMRHEPGATITASGGRGGVGALSGVGWREQRASLMPTREEFQQILEMAKFIADAGIGPQGTAGNIPKIVTVSIKGWELGLSMMQSLDGIHVIEGRTVLSAALLHGLVMQRIPGARVEWLKNGEDGEASIRCVRPGVRDVVLSYSWEQAVDAGLTSTKAGDPRPTWHRTGAAMLRAFVLRNGCRMQYPEVGFGLDPSDTMLVAPTTHDDVPMALPVRAVDDGATIRAPAHPGDALTGALSIGPPAPAPTHVTVGPRNPVPPDGVVGTATVTAGPDQGAATWGNAEPPPDETLPMKSGSFKGRTLGSLSPGEIQTLVSGYEKAIADETKVELKKQKESWRDKLIAWGVYREAQL